MPEIEDKFNKLKAKYDKLVLKNKNMQIKTLKLEDTVRILQDYYEEHERANQNPKT